VPQLPDTAGSPRARMRLIAVLLLALITAFWGVYAIYLLFLPEGSAGATFFVLLGAAYLLGAGLYALITWGTAKRMRALHIGAIVVTALGSLQFFSGVNEWTNWLVTVANLAALVLLALTIPRRKLES
jgi:hypothetical protein